MDIAAQCKCLMQQPDSSPSEIDNVVEPAYPSLLRMERIIKRNRVGQWLPLLVFAVSIFLTYQIWRDAERTAHQVLATDFTHQVREINRRLEQRMLVYEQVLRGTVGLFSAIGQPTREQFRAYVDTLRLADNYPGIQGIGYTILIPPERLETHIAAIRSEGFPEFNVTPPGERPLITSILYLEPFTGRNLRAFGFDMLTEPVRRAAMERARDTGLPAMSGRVTLVQEDGANPQPGMLMYLPVYRPGTLPATPEQRRAALSGWVYAPFRMHDLIGNIVSTATDRIDIEIYDGETPSVATRMLDLHRTVEATQTGPDTGMMRADQLRIGGRKWTVVTQALPALYRRAGFGRSQVIIGVGITFSLLLAMLAWLFVDDRIYAMKSARQAMQLALYDGLTGLPNRELLSDMVRKTIEQCRRDNTKMAMMFVDLDRFKPVNDTYGHAVGDMLLKKVAQRLKDCIRRADTAARIGGDEFVLLLPQFRDRDSVMAIADKVLACIVEPFEVAGHRLEISCSIGIAIFPEDGTDETALLKHADTAMYAAKDAGRNGAAFYDA